MRLLCTQLPVLLFTVVALPGFAATRPCASPIGIAPGTLPDASQGVAYPTQTITASGAASFTFAVTSGTLPNGLGLTNATATTVAVGGSPSAAGSFRFTITARSTSSGCSGGRTFTVKVNAAPLVTTTAGSTSFTEGGGPVVVDSGVTVTDSDNPSLASANVTITNPQNGAAEVLAASCGGLTVTPGVNTLSITGSQALATYQACLRSVTYNDTSADPGSTPRVVAFVANDGQANSATANKTVNVTPVNDPPAALTKSYNAQANMRISIPAGSGLLVGATDPDDPAAELTVGTVSATSPAGGTVSVTAATGAFDFGPPPGATGNVTFTYTVCDDGLPTPPVRCSAPATVTFNVSGPVIWFVNTAAGAGNGTLLTPFNTLAAATAAMGANTSQRIFVYSGIQGLGTGVTLQSGSWLAGQGLSGASFDAVMGISPPAGTIARPSIGAAAPTVRGTVNMNGSNTQVRGLSIQPPSGSAALVASLAGPFTGLVVSDLPNVTAISARAVNLNNVSGTFRINTVNAASTDVGINLNNVNPSTGSFTVAGVGGSCSAATPTCSGGTISNSTDAGVKLTNASNVTLTRLRVANSSNFGLSGNGVNGLSLDTCLFDGTHGNAVDEGALFVTNWLGSGTIANSEILGGANDNVRVTNTSGTLNRLTISGTTIRDNSTGATGNHGLRFGTNLASGTGAGVTMNLTVTGSTFRNNHSNHIDTGATGLSTMDLVLASNTFASNPTTLAGAVNITDDHQADVTFDVNANTSNGAQLSAFNFFMSNQTSAAASMVGRFRNNLIGTTGLVGSGSAQGDGLRVTASGLGTITTNITGNTIRQYAGSGMSMTAGDTSPQLNVTVTGNIVKEPVVAFALNGIRFEAGTTSAGTVTACADIGGAGALANDALGAGAGGSTDVRLRQRFSSNVTMPGYAGGANAANAAAFVAGRNSGPPTVSFTVAAPATGSLGNTAGGVPCPQAP